MERTAEFRDYTELMSRNAKGVPISKEEFPDTFALRRVERAFKSVYEKPLPDFFTSGLFFVSEAVADVFSQFDLGQGAVYPVTTYGRDGKTPIAGRYFVLNFGNVKSCVLPEESKDVGPGLFVPSSWNYRGFYNTLRECDYGITVTKDALREGPDLWLDKEVPSVLFLSDRLAQALKQAGVDKAFKLFRCKIV